MYLNRGYLQARRRFQIKSKRHFCIQRVDPDHEKTQPKGAKGPFECSSRRCQARPSLALGRRMHRHGRGCRARRLRSRHPRCQRLPQWPDGNPKPRLPNPVALAVPRSHPRSCCWPCWCPALGPALNAETVSNRLKPNLTAKNYLKKA